MPANSESASAGLLVALRRQPAGTRMIRSATVAAALVLVLASPSPVRAYVRAIAQQSQLPTFWASGCEIVTIHLNGFTQMTTDQVAKSIASAAHAWSPELVSCPDSATSDAGSGHPSFEIITQLASGAAVQSAVPDGKNVVIFQTENWEYYADAIALTTRSTDPSGRIFDADIEVNAATLDFVWANLDPNAPPAGGGQEQIDLQTAITHEFGHFLGLAHTCFNRGPDGETRPFDDQGQPSPDCPNGDAQQRAAVMWYFVDPGVLATAKRVVTTDDARGVCAIYPPSADVPVCAANLPDDGCGCRTGGRGCRPIAALLALAGLVGALRRRRRFSRDRDRSPKSQIDGPAREEPCAQAGMTIAQPLFVRRTTRLANIVVGVSSTLCAILTTPASAKAQAAAQPWTRQIAVEGQLGYGAPLGPSGLAIEADLSPWLSISAGLGTDIFFPEKYYTCPCPGGRNHAALMPRLRLPVFDGATFVALGVGISRSSTPEGAIPDVIRQDDEVAVEHRFENGVRARAFAGIGFSLSGPPGAFATPYIGAALAYAVMPNPDDSSASPSPWYGWQPAVSDAAAAVLAAHNRQYPHAFPTAVALYALTSPIVHVAHHHYGRAIASAVLRGVLPFVSMVALTTTDNNSGNDSRATLVVGAVVAALVDDLALSWGN